jgi:hypothetical protein
MVFISTLLWIVIQNKKRFARDDDSGRITGQTEQNVN